MEEAKQILFMGPKMMGAIIFDTIWPKFNLTLYKSQYCDGGDTDEYIQKYFKSNGDKYDAVLIDYSWSGMTIAIKSSGYNGLVVSLNSSKTQVDSDADVLAICNAKEGFPTLKEILDNHLF